jgi:hypothetical protein
MKMNLSFSLLLLAQSLVCCLCLGDDGSARRYANVMGNDELSFTFSLLERGDVQHELNTAPGQVAKIARICHPPDREVPGLAELVARYKKRRSDPAASPADREKSRKSFNSDLGRCIAAYQRKELSATLSLDQTQRLNELLTQMRGPIAVLDVPAISSKLQLSEKQRAEMADTVKHYEAGLGWLRARYGRQQISGLHKSTNETWEDRQKELEALFTVICAIEKERDADLLVELTPDQLASWSTIQGRLFPIAWPPTSVSDSPSGEQK